MVEPIRYGAGGVPMVNQPKPKKWRLHKRLQLQKG